MPKGKDSHNSHNPPSQDKYKPKRNKSLRKKISRKSGGQPGHKGHTLLQTNTPDQIRDLKSSYCESCGSDLSGLDQQLASKRQVVDIPPIQPVYTEYRQHEVLCSCGHCQKASYPSGVNAPIQYGSSVIALVSYFNVYQYIAYKRLAELFSDVFSLPLSLSEGSIENLLRESARNKLPKFGFIIFLNR